MTKLKFLNLAANQLASLPQTLSQLEVRTPFLFFFMSDLILSQDGFSSNSNLIEQGVVFTITLSSSRPADEMRGFADLGSSAEVSESKLARNRRI